MAMKRTPTARITLGFITPYACTTAVHEATRIINPPLDMGRKAAIKQKAPITRNVYRWRVDFAVRARATATTAPCAIWNAIVFGSISKELSAKAFWRSREASWKLLAFFAELKTPKVVKKRKRDNHIPARRNPYMPESNALLSLHRDATKTAPRTIRPMRNTS
jgi:hypothetical protein